MKLFDLFSKSADRDTKELEIYSGMRVVVEDLEGKMLFIAKLQEPLRDTAQLYQYSEAENIENTPKESFENTKNAVPVPVKIRGYNEWEDRAVFMEGLITPGPKRIWQVENLNIIRIENERSSLRVNTALDAVMFESAEAGAAEADTAESAAGGRICKLLNISVGGAGIASEHRYYKGDKFLLKIKLLEDSPAFIVYCEVLRVVQKDVSRYEYGCQFLELTDTVQEQITQNIARIADRGRQ